MKALRLVLLFVFVVGAAGLVSADEELRTASILEIDGDVDVKSSGQAWVPAKQGMTLNQGDIVKTGNNSSAVLNVDGTGETATVDLDENSQLLFSELLIDKEKKTQSTLMDLAIGKILIKAQKLHSDESKFEVKTPTTVVGVRGTTFSVEVEAIE